MSADILTRKYEKAFQLYDADGSGYVDESDVKRMQDQLVAAFGAAGTPKEPAVREGIDEFWSALTSAMDRNLDDRLSREEWVSGLGQLSQDAASFDAVFAPVVDAVFTLMDTDDSGVVTDDEFRRFQAGLGNADQADAALAKIDRDGDGVISREEFLADIRAFMTSDDPDDTNNWFLGRL